MVWTCHEETPRICRKKDDGNEVIGKEEKRERPKRKFLDVTKEGMGVVGAKEKDVENRTVWRKIIRCGYQ